MTASVLYRAYRPTPPHGEPPWWGWYAAALAVVLIAWMLEVASR